MKVFLIVLIVFIKFNSISQNYLEIGKKHHECSKYDSAIYFFDLGIKESNSIKDTTFGYLTVYKGKSLQLQNKYVLALENYIQALKIFKSNKQFNGEAFTYIVLAEFKRYFAQYDEALEYLNLANKIYLKNGLSKVNQAYLFNRYAAVFNENGADKKIVIHYSEKVLELARQINNLDLEASSLREIGYVYEMKGNIKSFDYYFKVLKFYQDLNNLKYIADMYFIISRCYYTFNMYNKSIDYANKGLKISEVNNWHRISRDLLFYKHKDLNKLGRHKEANIEMGHHFEYVFLVRQAEWDKEIKDIETKFEVDKKDNQIILEQEKSTLLKKEAKQKQKENQLYILLSVLLALILSISIYAYFKIKKTNKLLNKNIGQKEILLQEVHHRVKNNLTVLNSLLYLRSKKSVNKETKLVLDECQTRIQSMALVHQNLYDVEDAEFVNLDKFITQLINESKQIFKIGHISIQSDVNTNNIQFDMSFTVFLGLILNELITNSFKYAFDPNSDDNTITIDLIAENENYVLYFSDSGLGLAKDFDLTKTEGFGFKLIKIMVNQIRGTLNYTENNNTFILKFKKTK